VPRAVQPLGDTLQRPFFRSLPSPRELIDIETLVIQQEAVLDIAENRVQPLHSIDNLKRSVLVGKQEQWERIILKDTVNQPLFLAHSPNEFSLILPVHDE
jgi:hypothetical protein